MLISTTNLAILPVIDKKHDKEVLRSAHIKDGYLYGTDEHSLYKSKLPDTALESEYPIIEEGEREEITSDMIPAQLLEKAEKALPKTYVPTVIAEHVCVTETDKYISAETTDLDTTTSYKARKVQGNYPNVKGIDSKFYSPVETILSLESLKTLVKIADKAKKAESKRQNKKILDVDFGIALTIEGNGDITKPIKVELLNITEEISGIIMPMRKKKEV